jgi:catechol 2,3-dioxygenase-like lactoylglutathione lyase family enzyme
MKTNMILYVSDQQASASFYEKVLLQKPVLDVPGMTQFKLNEDTELGLMPVAGIRKLLGESLPDPEKAKGIPRAEIYLSVEDPEAFHQRAIANNAKELSPLLPRGWGDDAAYSMDSDGHVLVFARRTKAN